jgi:hypothetical protein
MEHHEDGIVGSKILDLFQKDHGADAQAGDMERAIEAEKLENSDSVLK